MVVPAKAGTRLSLNGGVDGSTKQYGVHMLAHFEVHAEISLSRFSNSL